VENSSIATIEVLLESGADLTARKKISLESALHLAAKKGHKKMLEMIAEACKQKFANTEQKSDKTEEEAEAELEQNPLYFVDLSGSNVLHVVLSSFPVEKGDMQPFLLLLNYTGESLLNANTKSGATLLHQAAMKGNVTMVRFLLEQQKLDLESRSTFGTTPLQEACAQGFETIVRLLIGNGAQVNTRDNDGLTPLHTTCSSANAYPNRAAIVKILVEAGADANAKSTGNPLHSLCFCTGNDNDVVATANYLLAQGADYKMENAAGWTPLRCAYAEQGNKACIQVLEEYLQQKDPTFLETFDKHKPRRS